MTDIAIRVEGLGKQYRIGKRERYRTLRDTLAEAATLPFRLVRSQASSSRNVDTGNSGDLIWALRDVSFEVPQGSVVGIIGRNGTGKSTLLKILSRITELTEGRVEILGRVGSLLEVGTGFHPELTGRENIFLNGAILGMRRTEIARKFDEIGAFAEVDKFIDTPVKHYSSGMYMRLAFAVAAHLEPEILIVDEVLAVGDGQFQKKCLGKLGDVARKGRTVIFVSHQMNQIRRLCDRGIWLDCGAVRQVGAPAAIISAYEAAFGYVPQTGRRDGNVARFLRWEIVQDGDRPPHMLSTLGPVTLRFVLQVDRPIVNGHNGVALFDRDNQLMWATAVDGLKLATGTRELLYRFPSLPLRPGTYYWHVSLLNDSQSADDWYCVPSFVVGTEPVTHPLDRFQGVLNLPWELEVC